ncbi:hypothetical protein B0O99DRAFT_603216 [Bisporella sp. PMI_857]|nr:hypothetical protein B0O99DRAFT_603216 [Bisporella sp. PMI_857]
MSVETELEKKLGLALEKQVDSLLASSPSFLHARSVEALQNKIKSRERTKAFSSRLEKLRNAFRNSTLARDFEERKQQKTQVTKDQLKILLNYTLLAKLEKIFKEQFANGTRFETAFSTDSLSRAQSKIYPKYLKALTDNEHCYTSRIFRSSSGFSFLLGLVQSSNPETEKRKKKRKHQNTHILTSSETHYLVNIDNYNICDTGNEAPQRAKRRKPSAALVATPTTCRKHFPEPRFKQPSPRVALSATAAEIGDA